MRTVLDRLGRAGVVRPQAGRRIPMRHGDEGKRFPGLQTGSTAAPVELRFMEWILTGECRPGAPITCSGLARRFRTSTSAVREHLAYMAALRRRDTLMRSIAP